MPLGTSPPTGFINQSLTEMKVDNTFARSSPRSMLIRNNSLSDWQYGRKEITFTKERLTFYAYFPSTTHFRRVHTLSVTGNNSDLRIVSMLYFRNTGSIDFSTKVGGVNSLVASGYSYLADVWQKFDVEIDFSTNRWNAWYNDQQIVTNAQFWENNAITDVKAVHFCASQSTNPDSKMWIDDISISPLQTIIKSATLKNARLVT